MLFRSIKQKSASALAHYSIGRVAQISIGANNLYGPAGGKGLGSMLAKAAGGHSEGFEAGAILHPSVGIPAYLAKKAGSALLGKLASSENPALIRLLTGGSKGIDPATAEFIAKALGSTGAAVGTQ